MSPRRVRFTAIAEGHVNRERLWWRENRAHTEVFAPELEEAVRILAFLDLAAASITPVQNWHPEVKN